MKVIGFFNSKGGSGKSTLALHFAVAAAHQLRVVILDADPNKSAWRWGQVRKDVSGLMAPMVKTTTASTLKADLAKLRADGIELVILDCPPYITADSALLVTAVDCVVVPVQPTFLDVTGCHNAINIVRSQKKPFIYVISRGPSRGSKRMEKITEALRATAEVCPTWIANRNAFAEAFDEGKAVMEIEEGTKSVAEIFALSLWIMEKAGVEYEQA